MSDAEYKLTDEQIETIRLQVGYAAGSERFAKIARAIEAATAVKYAERIAELERENFALAAGQCIHDDGLTADEGGTPYCQKQKQIAELQAKLDAAAVDAKRYLFLRNEAQWLEGVPQAIIWRTDGHAQEICSEEDLDAAIDDAMRTGEPKV